jgi:hypothetical protein
MSEVTSKGAALGLALFTAAAASAVNNPAQAQIAQGQCPPDTKTVVGWVRPFIQDGITQATILKNSTAANPDAVLAVARDANLANISFFVNQCGNEVDPPPSPPSCPGNNQYLAGYALQRFNEAKIELQAYEKQPSPLSRDALTIASYVQHLMARIDSTLDPCIH